MKPDLRSTENVSLKDLSNFQFLACIEARDKGMVILPVSNIVLDELKSKFTVCYPVRFVRYTLAIEYLEWEQK